MSIYIDVVDFSPLFEFALSYTLWGAGTEIEYFYKTTK